MKAVKRPINNHTHYHAHVYFNETTKAYAKILCQQAGQVFNLKVGRFHEKLVGPHPCWSCQISFTCEDFEHFIPWLNIKRKALTVFVHGLTGNDLNDHTEFAYWLGDEQTLNLAQFL